VNSVNATNAFRALGAPRFKTVVFDVDSTVSAIEGIDWLAALRDEDVARESELLTAQAMAGEIPIEAAYMRRLDRIKPAASELLMLADAYQQSIVPGMRELIGVLQRARVHVHLLSGGLRAAIVPMALHLGVPADRVHAVSLSRDVDGRFSLLDGEQPLATQRGKPLVVQRLQLRKPIAMIGDGSTDAAVRGVVDAFFAFTAVARRDSVIKVADAEAASVDDLYPLLFEVP